MRKITEIRGIFSEINNKFRNFIQNSEILGELSEKSEEFQPQIFFRKGTVVRETPNISQNDQKRIKPVKLSVTP